MTIVREIGQGRGIVLNSDVEVLQKLCIFLGFADVNFQKYQWIIDAVAWDDFNHAELIQRSIINTLSPTKNKKLSCKEAQKVSVMHVDNHLPFSHLDYFQPTDDQWHDD